MIKKIVVILGLLALLTIPTIIDAQTVIPKPKTLPGVELDFSTSKGKEEAKNFLPNYFAPRLTQIFIGFAGIVAFFGLIWAGILYVTAYGREDQIGNAKKIVTWSLVGLTIAIFSYAIVSIITQIKLIT